MDSAYPGRVRAALAGHPGSQDMEKSSLHRENHHSEEITTHCVHSKVGWVGKWLTSRRTSRAVESSALGRPSVVRAEFSSANGSSALSVSQPACLPGDRCSGWRDFPSREFFARARARARAGLGNRRCLTQSVCWLGWLSRRR
jgi:hypothetical protein